MIEARKNIEEGRQAFQTVVRQAVVIGTPDQRNLNDFCRRLVETQQKLLKYRGSDNAR